ncbi:hypothetical protein [Desmospora activa]|uniref:Uncharacterized protein n=1 Tax=Desmospora activa DSM 45169 TaxID=1121389 RepID=A0A2T4ZA40_9BACL|nr:hypothetical protein [Desmospora activa]PTM58766.1 hypothetical protein C8J48_1356 [Desmospora activa DSM 45169]
MTQEQGFPDYAPVPDFPTHDGFGPSFYTQQANPYSPYGYAAYGNPGGPQTSLFPFFGFPFFRPFPFFPPFGGPFFGRPFFW